MQLTPAALGEATRALVGDDANARFGIAVSGGPDSMALLHLAAAAWGGRVEAVTIDHGLRAASAEEAAMVAQWCAKQGIPHSILTPDTAPDGNVQAWGRAQRYALIERWRTERGIDWTLTAHHADDQLETLLMRLNRGSGVAGLAGVRARRGRVIRPLLSVRKAALAVHCAENAVPYVDDPSNEDHRFDRANLRAELRDAPWLNPEAAACSAAALSQAEEALSWSVETLAREHVRPDGAGWSLDRIDLPHEYLRRLILLMLARAAPDAPQPRGEALDHAIAKALQGGKASLGDWLIAGGMTLRLFPAPPRKF